ncbi:FAD-binding domain-containing protein [Streptomyces sp. NPDC052301]|uniref:FAD-binding domain-containing protein n=1 Tax=Streptomyces sp. NPDC052301 TaxID=3365687 RepID=UPI0037D04F71
MADEWAGWTAGVKGAATQWVAGTGIRPGRVLDPVTQAERYDPDGIHVRRRVPELRDVGDPAVDEPWKPTGTDRAALDHTG